VWPLAGLSAEESAQFACDLRSKRYSLPGLAPNSGNLVAWRELALLAWMAAAISSYPVFKPNSNFQLLTRLTVLFGKVWRRPSFAISPRLSCGFTLRRQRE
jgi:hypothetical protein